MGFAMLKRRVLLLAWSGLLLAFTGCGGGGGGGSGSGGGGAGEGGTGGSPGNTPSGTLSVEQRNVATARLSDRFEQLTNGADVATPDMWEQLRAWVMTQPEFIDAGVGDQVLWARFKDGRYFLFTDNWRPLPPQPLAAAKPLLKQAPLLKQELPASVNALLLSDSNADFADSGPVMDRIATALHESGWAPTAKSLLSIDTLRSQGELGFLFLTAHSGVLGPPGEEQFAMITDDLATIANDFSYSSELEDGSLIYHRARRKLERVGLNDGLRYAITARFVDRYLRFSPEALVILVGCHSGSKEAKVFRDAFLLRGAGTVIGWDGNTNANAYAMVDLMVDRLTGMNSPAVQPVTPANRPFNFEDVWFYLDKKGLLLTPPPGGIGTSTPVRRFGTDFRILRPVLRELEATGVDKLLLHGDFGTQPATVTVGGRQFPATTLAGGTTLKVDLGREAHGDVVVTTRDRRSNRRVLGSWRGQVAYTQTFPSGCPQALFSNTVNINLHLRADAHPIRYEVDGPLFNNQRLVMPASDTSAAWSAAGSCTAPDGDTETWSGSGNLPFAVFGEDAPLPPPNPNLIAARIDALQSRFQFMILVANARLVDVQAGDIAFQLPLQIDSSLYEFQNDGSNPGLMSFGNFLPLDGARNVAAGQYRKAQTHQPAEALTVQWGSMPVAPSYDASVPR